MRQVPPPKALPDKTLIYLGTSMNPTFADLDLLTYSSPDEPIRVGDVIAFQQPESDLVVIHRVISSEGTALRTQGDNNPLPDPYTVDRDRVVGIIRVRQRNRKRCIVHGGRRGLARYRYLRGRKRVARTIAGLMRPCYRVLVRHRLISRFSTRVIPWEIQTITQTEGCVQRLWCCGRLAGIRHPDSPEWHMRTPFPIVIDATQLPLPDGVNKSPQPEE